MFIQEGTRAGLYNLFGCLAVTEVNENAVFNNILNGKSRLKQYVERLLSSDMHFEQNINFNDILNGILLLKCALCYKPNGLLIQSVSMGSAS